MCPLCEIAKGKNITTEIHYPPKDRIGEMDWTILDCKTRHAQLAVFRDHKTTLTIRQLHRLIDILEVKWPRDKWDYELDFQMGGLEHVHAHILNLRKVK